MTNTPEVNRLDRVRVSWSRWDPKRLRMVTSHPWVWMWTDIEGTERTFDTKAEAEQAMAAAS